jgi:hypothetical protein
MLVTRGGRAASTGGMAPDGHPRGKIRWGVTRAILPQQRTSLRAHSPSLAFLIPWRPCAGRDEEQVTYGPDMNTDYLIGARCLVPGYLD